MMHRSKKFRVAGAKNTSMRKARSTCEAMAPPKA